jgi:hypothetical protein
MELGHEVAGDPENTVVIPLTPASTVPALNPPVLTPGSCASCGSTPASDATRGIPARPTQSVPSWVYAIGKLEARFPSVSVEKEFAQATGRADTRGLTDRQALQAVLSVRENRYLVRQLCWVMSVEGMDTFIVMPRDPGDYNLLVRALRPNPSPLDLDIVIGMKGPIASPQMCNGLLLPVVIFDQIYSFDREALVEALPNSGNREVGEAAEELFDRIKLMTDNTGSSNEHRALNYLAVRYPAIYAKVAEYFDKNHSLSAINVRRSQLSGTRQLVDVIFSFTNRATDVVEKVFTRVDVTDEFPFLVTKLSPYFDR